MLKVGQIVEVRGEKVRILSLDADPRCDVWAVSMNDPDRSVWFKQEEAK